MILKNKKIVFLTGTRADFGKLKSLISISQKSPDFHVSIFVTGMHMDEKYGFTVNEIYKSNFKNINTFDNKDISNKMELALANTIKGFSDFITKSKPDLIIVHGDRVEALAGSIVGSINNILVGHIEGGEISGTIDELIRHAITKMSHIHFVSNDEARQRLVQLGESEKSIYIVGSPDLDLMCPSNLPDINLVKNYYEINFENYSIAMFHPVTTEVNSIQKDILEFVRAIQNSNLNYILIYPNNDLGSNIIINEYKKLGQQKKIKIFPSIRFEFFLSLLKNCDFIIGNSSAGIREAPYFDVPTIDVGTRQNNRYKKNQSIFHAKNCSKDIEKKIEELLKTKSTLKYHNHAFGDGNSDKQFLKILLANDLWQTNKQKQFIDLNNEE